MTPNSSVNRSELNEPFGDGGMGVVDQALDVQTTPSLPGTTLTAQIDEHLRQRLISELFDRARTHIERHNFPEARNALTEIFNLKYDHPEAARLKSALDAREMEATLARTEKEKLFTVAQRHQRNGELGSALTQIEKMLDLSRNVPASSVPEREKVFAALYAELQTERNRINHCCTDASHALAESNFEKALAICDSLQARYPNNPEFPALRLKAQQAKRQQLLAYVGEVACSMEAEPNLDGRVCLLQEAVKRYPNEELLAGQLSLACEQRDLAASMVAKARAYEVQYQFAEAIHQWKVLLLIYPLYPGLAAEIQQVEQRREQKAEEDKRSRFLAEIERTLTSGAYTDAERLSQEGLREFPEHPQLLALLGHANQGFEKCREADRLLEEAKTFRVSGDPDRAITLLRQSLHLDPRHVVARNTLVHLLLENARVLLDTDLSAAESLAVEAAKLDPEHSSLQNILKRMAKAKRKQPRQPALLEAGSGPDAARIESIPAPQPTKLFPDDDFPEPSRASHRFVAQPPQPAGGPSILQHFREIGSVLVYNVKSRLLDSNWAPYLLKLSESSRISLSARQIRGFMFALLGGLVLLLLLSFAYRFVSRPHVPKPMTAASEAASISPVAPATPTEAIRTAPSYASVEPNGDPDAGTPLPLVPVSRQGTFDSSPAAADRTIERPAAHPKQPIAVKNATPGNRHFNMSAKAPADVYRALSLPSGDYESTAEAPHFASKLVDVKIQGDQTATVSFDLKPSARTVVERNTEFVNPDEAIKTDGRWYHGRTDKYIRLTTNSPTNTLLFSKEFKVKRTSWRVNLDGNTITYTLDAKGISIEKHIDAHDSTERIKTDLSNATTPSESYAVTVKLEKNDVIIARPDGTPLHTTHTEDHDWSQAGVFAKGDTYFSFLPGR